MEEEFRPAFREVVLASALASALRWFLVPIIISLLPVLGYVVSPIDELAGTFAATFFVLWVGSFLNLHAEERYYVGEGVLRTRRTLASTAATTILLQNVTTVRVDVPVLHAPLPRRDGLGLHVRLPDPQALQPEGPAGRGSEVGV